MSQLCPRSTPSQREDGRFWTPAKPNVAALARLVGFAALATALISGCGASPKARGFEPKYAGLDAYERRCEQINERGAMAQVVYEASKEMKVGDSDTVRAAVTLDQSAPPERVLPRADAAGAPGLVVSCRVQARLDASEYEFEIDEGDWIDRSVYETDTARWIWSVTPKVGGDHELTLFVRPIVRQRRQGDRSETSLAAEASIRDFTTHVHVDVPWNKRPEAFMTQVASTFNVAESLVKALTALLAAVGALWLAIRGFRRRQDKRTSS